MPSKLKNLEKYLTELNGQGLCLAFSGGIDSTVLLHLCRNLKILALTFDSGFQTEEEINRTKDLCEKYNIRQIIIKTDVFQNPVICQNPKDRCYHCKKLLFSEALKIAKENGKKYVIDGTNYDDLSAYRPGVKALRELGIISPLAQLKITKKEIREYAKSCKIATFNKPAAPCLATRFPYGTKLTPEILKIVEKGEEILKFYDFASCRLRLHGNIARIEIPPENFIEFLNKKTEIVTKLKNLGITYITLDLDGLRSGSMDIF